MNRNKSFIIKGNICYSISEDEIRTVQRGYLVCEDGLSMGVFSEYPAKYDGLPIKDYGDFLIFPGMVDLHLHAPQYSFRGIGMDMELLDWLNTYTFPEEAKYVDYNYAKKAYEMFVEDLRVGATTRACIFATIHREATELLMDLLEKTDLKTMVGKVNMDRNSPDYLREESAKISAEDTVRWITETIGKYENTKPIITPRFIPSCSDELMKYLGEIRTKWDLCVQSHLAENQQEVAWVRKLCPDSLGYADAYEQSDMLGGSYKAIMAHCVYLSEEEEDMLLRNGVYVAHCPQSNTNLASGIAPIRRYRKKQMKIGLGTDVAGGFSSSILRAIADAIQVSKLRSHTTGEFLAPLSFDEAFYLGTKGGGEFFGKVGSFEKGYEFDAVVVDDSRLLSPNEFTLRQRLERIVYLSELCSIKAKYVAGSCVLDTAN